MRQLGGQRALLIFVRAPEPGRVKTRLAAEVGEAAALRVYRLLAERTLSAARALGAGVGIRVHYTPAEAGPSVAAWLGEGVTYLPQAEGDLGERMASAFADAVCCGMRRMVIVGTDLPAIEASLLERAFALLERHEVVIGPATDGGYYLLGLREPRPELFRGVPWSTADVLPTTLRRLREAGIEPAQLETLADVDRAADVPPELAAAAAIHLHDS